MNEYLGVETRSREQIQFYFIEEMLSIYANSSKLSRRQQWYSQVASLSVTKLHVVSIHYNITTYDGYNLL